MPTLEIACAEDDDANRTLLVLRLTRLGHRVTACRNGEELLEHCLRKDAHYDLVLLDIKMPGLDGLAVARILRSEPRTQHYPIFFITACAMAADLEAASSAKPDAILIKPFSTAQLVQAIENLKPSASPPSSSSDRTHFRPACAGAD